MAHPYKQKYNNFNGPGHQSPANNIVRGAWELIKLGGKHGKKVWRFIKDQTIPITTRNIKNPSKGQKWKFNPKAVRNYAFGTAYTKGSDLLDNYNQVKKDNTRVKQSEYFKNIENITKPRPLNIDTTGLGFDEDFNYIKK